MDPATLLIDSSIARARMIADLARQSNGFRHSLLQICRQDRHQISPRAAHALGVCAENYPGIIQDSMPEIIETLCHVKNGSTRRNLLRIFTFSPLPDDDHCHGLLMDRCFKWLNDPSESIAMKIYAMDVLCKLTALYPDISQELSETIEALIQRDSSAIRYHGSYVLKRLNNLSFNDKDKSE